MGALGEPGAARSAVTRSAALRVRSCSAQVARGLLGRDEFAEYAHVGLEPVQHRGGIAGAVVFGR